MFDTHIIHLQIYQPIPYFPIHMLLSCVMYLHIYIFIYWHSRCFKGISCTIYLFQLQLLYISKSQHNGMKTLSIFACSGSTCSSQNHTTSTGNSNTKPKQFTLLSDTLVRDMWYVFFLSVRCCTPYVRCYACDHIHSWTKYRNQMSSLKSSFRPSLKYFNDIQ